MWVIGWLRTVSYEEANASIPLQEEETRKGAGKLTQWAKAPTDKPGSLSLSFVTHVVEGERNDSSCPLTSTLIP